MSGWVVNVTLDVLASDPPEIKDIEAALQEPSEELIAWYANKCNENHVDMDPDFKEVVVFKQTTKLGYVHESVNKARRFYNSFEEPCWRLVSSHIDLVSEHFPKAICLVQYSNTRGYGGKLVIRGGKLIRYCHFDDRGDIEVPQWALPNIFAPYQEEYDRRLEFGSLWDKWVEDMRQAAAELAGDAHEPNHDASAPHQPKEAPQS